MSPYRCFLVTVYYESANKLMKCAVKLDGEEWMDHPTWSENKLLMHSMLPLHVQHCGPVVDVEEIFEVSIIESA